LTANDIVVQVHYSGTTTTPTWRLFWYRLAVAPRSGRRAGCFLFLFCVSCQLSYFSVTILREIIETK